jgi:hypothetical protein
MTPSGESKESVMRFLKDVVQAIVNGLSYLIGCRPRYPEGWPVDFETIEVVSADGLVMVELDFIGEGSSGEFDPEDSSDEPLLRFTLFRRWSADLDQDKFAILCDTDAYGDGEWAAVRDGSYCTQINAFGSKPKHEAAAMYILRQVEDEVRCLRRNKRHWEGLSWIGLDDRSDEPTYIRQ